MCFGIVEGVNNQMTQRQYTPHIEWCADHESLYVRFANLPRTKFDHTLAQFQSVVSRYIWNADKRFWEVPLADIQTVALFAELNFGKNSMVYIGKQSIPKQIGLPFYD